MAFGNETPRPLPVVSVVLTLTGQGNGAHAVASPASSCLIFESSAEVLESCAITGTAFND